MRCGNAKREIFGSAEFRSPLITQIAKNPQIKQFEPWDRDLVDPFGPTAYAIFPAVENKQKLLMGELHFDSQLSWDPLSRLKMRRAAQNAQLLRDRKPPLPETIEDIGPEIELALRAWVCYGGIGSRTRRGCGAIHCESIQSELPPLSRQNPDR
jgi:CRISPR-associated protein Cmr1